MTYQAPTPSGGPPGAPEVSIVIVSYNTKDLTLRCIASALDNTHLPFEVIVVDNDSTDGSADAIAAAFPSVLLIPEKYNHGFGVACNIGASRARGGYILLLNPDTIVLPGAIDTLHAFASANPDAGIWGGRTLREDGTLQEGSCWARMSLWTLFCMSSGLCSAFPQSALFNPEAYGGWRRDSVRRVDIVTGCFLLIGRPLWDRLGGFDKRYFMYGEDADMCLRAHTQGAKPMITPEAAIIHLGGASERMRADKLVRLMKGKMTLINTHFPPSEVGLARWLLMAWPFSRSFVGSTWREVWHRRNEWIAGY